MQTLALCVVKMFLLMLVTSAFDSADSNSSRILFQTATGLSSPSESMYLLKSSTALTIRLALSSGISAVTRSFEFGLAARFLTWDKASSLADVVTNAKM